MQGAQVWLWFLCQRRRPEVTVILKGDVPLTYLLQFHSRLVCFPSNLHVTGFSSCRITSMIHSYLVCAVYVHGVFSLFLPHASRTFTSRHDKINFADGMKPPAKYRIPLATGGGRSIFMRHILFKHQQSAAVCFSAGCTWWVQRTRRTNG